MKVPGGQGTVELGRRTLLAVWGLGALGGCRRASAAGGRLTVAGSSTVQPVCELAAQAFEREHPGARVEVQGGGSGAGIRTTRSGLAGVGMVSRALHPDERDLTAYTIGLDGIALIVHGTNPAQNLTRQQVVDIYTGATTDWASVGGAPGPITVVNKEEGRSTLELFEQHFGLRGRFVRNAVIIGPNGQAIATVAASPAAVAYVSIGSATAAIAQGTPLKLLALDGVAATVENVRSGRFPLRRELNLVTRGPAAGLARDFITFVRGPEGRRIVAAQDFVLP
ncbi:MAG: phosphate ABC transporter substrate-binding protein [Deltaproteobacteria bacterium]|nr:phosphate ABC transporter substrate-binding protein [Deltaproteobacteria bacterium]